MATATHAAAMRRLIGMEGSRVDLHARTCAKPTIDSCHVSKAVRGNYCSYSGGLPQSRSAIVVSNGKRGVLVRATNLDDALPARTSFTPSVDSLLLESELTSVGSSSGSAISSLPHDRDISVLQDISLFPSESSSSDIARPQPIIVQGFAESPFVGEFAMDISAGAVSGGSEFEAMAASLPSYEPRWIWFAKSADEENAVIDRAINATIIGSAGILALTKMLTIDHDYWHGWTVFEILQYAPVHNWFAYEELLKTHPVLAKMMISGTVYSLGDWIAQCYEGKAVLEFNRIRMIRSGLVGFCLHGSMSHFYYHFCEWLFPFQGWWILPLKVGFDQTIWSGIWNSIYFITVGLLRFESPANILKELRETFFPLLSAGWKLWPFAHLITYGLIPVEQRLLWVDMVEIVWVTILAMYANEKSEARIAEEENTDLIKETLVEATLSNMPIDEVMSEAGRGS